MRIFLIRSPAVHVQLHRRPGLPLEVAGIHHEVLATENTVHVGCDVRLSGKPGADISRDVETDIFPLSACLVARPDSGITLRAGPTVERDDERTCVVSVIRHDMSDISHTVQTERVAPTDPCHVCFRTRTPASRTSFTMSRCSKALMLSFGCRSDCVQRPISTPFL